MSRNKMSTNTAGLRKKETYSELIDYIQNDQDIIRYPDRAAKQLRESPYLTQLDGDGMMDMQTQEANEMAYQKKRLPASGNGSGRRTECN